MRGEGSPGQPGYPQHCKQLLRGSTANCVCSTPVSPWTNPTHVWRGCAPPSSWALAERRGMICLHLQPWPLATPQITPATIWKSLRWNVVFPAIKFTKCWCFVSVTSTQKEDIKPHMFMDALSELLFAKAGSVRSFQRIASAWISPRL